MKFEEGKSYYMISSRDKRYYCEILVKYIYGSMVNFIVLDSYHPANIQTEHTYKINGAFFSEYYVVTPKELLKMIDKALDDRDEQRFYELTNLLGGK